MGNGPATSEGIDQFVRDLLDAWNAHDVGRIETFYAPQYEAWMSVRQSHNAGGKVSPDPWAGTCRPSPTCGS